MSEQIFLLSAMPLIWIHGIAIGYALRAALRATDHQETT